MGRGGLLKILKKINPKIIFGLAGTSSYIGILGLLNHLNLIENSFMLYFLYVIYQLFVLIVFKIIFYKSINENEIGSRFGLFLYFGPLRHIS